MSSVNVDYEYLIRFRQTLLNNAQHFDEIRTSIGTTINTIAETDWRDEKSQQFSNVFFGQSDKDIIKLVDTMQGFAAYLQQKIDVLMQYHATNINF